MSTNEDLEQFAVPEQAQEQLPPAPVDQTPNEVRVAFLAHILTGCPFMRRYEVANVGFVEFATISPSELDHLRYLAVLGVPHQVGVDRLRALLAVACVNRLEIDGRMIAPVQDRLWASSAAYTTFLESIPLGMLQIIESHYLDFSHTLSYLVKKVSDRSFWPTP